MENHRRKSSRRSTNDMSMVDSNQNLNGFYYQGYDVQPQYPIYQEVNTMYSPPYHNHFYDHNNYRPQTFYPYNGRTNSGYEYNSYYYPYSDGVTGYVPLPYQYHTYSHPGPSYQQMYNNASMEPYSSNGYEPTSHVGFECQQSRMRRSKTPESHHHYHSQDQCSPKTQRQANALFHCKLQKSQHDPSFVHLKVLPQTHRSRTPNEKIKKPKASNTSYVEVLKATKNLGSKHDDLKSCKNLRSPSEECDSTSKLYISDCNTTTGNNLIVSETLISPPSTNSSVTSCPDSGISVHSDRCNNNDDLEIGEIENNEIDEEDKNFDNNKKRGYSNRMSPDEHPNCSLRITNPKNAMEIEDPNVSNTTDDDEALADVKESMRNLCQTSMIERKPENLPTSLTDKAKETEPSSTPFTPYPRHDDQQQSESYHYYDHYQQRQQQQQLHLEAQQQHSQQEPHPSQSLDQHHQEQQNQKLLSQHPPHQPSEQQFHQEQHHQHQQQPYPPQQQHSFYQQQQQQYPFHYQQHQQRYFNPHQGPMPPINPNRNFSTCCQNDYHHYPHQQQQQQHHHHQQQRHYQNYPYSHPPYHTNQSNGNWSPRYNNNNWSHSISPSMPTSKSSVMNRKRPLNQRSNLNSQQKEPQRPKVTQQSSTKTSISIVVKKNRVLECDFIPSKKSKHKLKSNTVEDATECREEIKDIKPLPGFQQAFGSTEIGRFSEIFLYSSTTENLPQQSTTSSSNDYFYNTATTHGYESEEADTASPYPWDTGDSLEGPHFNSHPATKNHNNNNSSLMMSPQSSSAYHHNSQNFDNHKNDENYFRGIRNYNEY